MKHSLRNTNMIMHEHINKIINIYNNVIEVVSPIAMDKLVSTQINLLSKTFPRN